MLISKSCFGKRGCLVFYFFGVMSLHKTKQQWGIEYNCGFKSKNEQKRFFCFLSVNRNGD